MFDHGTFCRFGDAQIQYSTIFLRSTQTIVYIFDLTLIFHYNSRCAKTENRATKLNCRKKHHRQMGRQYNLIIRGRSNKSSSLVRQKVGSKLTANQFFPLHGLCICHACFSFQLFANGGYQHAPGRKGNKRARAIATNHYSLAPYKTGEQAIHYLATRSMYSDIHAHGGSKQVRFADDAKKRTRRGEIFLFVRSWAHTCNLL